VDTADALVAEDPAQRYGHGAVEDVDVGAAHHRGGRADHGLVGAGERDRAGFQGDFAVSEDEGGHRVRTRHADLWGTLLTGEGVRFTKLEGPGKQAGHPDRFSSEGVKPRAWAPNTRPYCRT